MSLNRRRALLALATCALTTLCGRSALADNVVFARHLSLSPDGATLAFCWAGDVWTVPVTGGAARRLTVHPAHDSHPVWSRDGQLLAFSSRRHGGDSVFVMNRAGGEIRRLTFDDRSAVPTDWSPDDKFVYYHSSQEGQLFWEPKVYRVAIEVGQPVRAMDCYAADARVSPDGRYIAFVRGGSKWWRRGYRGSANYDVWVHDTQTGEFTRLTDFDGTDRLPVWNAQGRGLYYLSDRAGTVNVWTQPLAGGEPEQLTHLTDDDVRDLAISADGRTLAFTHWDRLYVMSLPGGQPRQISVTAAADLPWESIDRQTLRNNASEVEVSPDAEEIALVVRGEVFVIKTEEKKPTRRVTASPYRDRHVTWSPDGKALFFVSDRTGVEQVFRATSAEEPAKALSDSMRFRIEQVTDQADPCYGPDVSPDGKKLAYVRLRGDLIIRDLKSGEESVLLESWNGPEFNWSADSAWIAYSVEDIEHNSDVWVVPADGSAPAVNISRHPDYDGDPQWSQDGNMLAFSSQRHGFDADLYLVFLPPELNELSSVDHDEYFKKRGQKVKKLEPLKSAVASGKIRLAGVEPETQPTTEPASQPAAEKEEKAEDEGEESLSEQLRTLLKQFLEEPSKKPSKKEEKEEGKEKKYEYELETAYKRIRRVTRLPNSQSQFAFAPTGELLAFTSNHDGDTKLYTIKWNGEDQKRILSSGVGALHWSLTGSRLFYLMGGVPSSCSATGSDAKAHSFRAKMAIDYYAEARQKFDDAARALGRGFYHPTLKGLDWPALTDKYRALALKTGTATEFNEIFSMLMGELNGSHLGIGGGGRGGGSRERVGYLGCEFDPAFSGPGLKVTAITARSPADRTESKLVPGDILLTVNGQPVGPTEPLDRALIDTVGDPVILEYVPSPDRKDEPAEDADKGARESGDKSGETGASAEETAAGEPPVDAANAKEAEPAEPETREMIIRPTSYGGYAGLQYDAWVEANRKYVEERSGGRLGYCHIRGMSTPSFEVFERDLYAAAHGKEGLIIDVRNNGGGWTADWVLAVLSVRRHAYTVPRGAQEHGYPQGRLIFYAWTRPATMICNQYSYSNAEIVSHAFKNLKRGPLVGMTTFGAVISTGRYRLIDGSYVRMPFRGWYTLPDKVDMELHGAEPDVLVPEGPADEAAGRQPQLDAAIRVTLEQVEAEGSDVH